MLYNVTWEESKTKQIYNATKSSEDLMLYLEKSLLDNKLCELIGEQPVPEKGREYGVMVYYYTSHPKRRLLSAAPRRDHDHIHVVIFRGILTREYLNKYNFDSGNSSDPVPDIKIHKKEEIDLLVELLKAKVQLI